MKHYNIPVFVPHLGCPNDCVFCNQKKITGVSWVDSDMIKTTIDTYLQSFTKEAYIEVAFFGGSFTGIPIQEQNTYLAIAKHYIESGRIDGIRISTRPDYIDVETLERLKAYGVTAIELGLQSLDPDVIKASKRGHDLDCVYTACDLIKSYDIELGLQMMIGLPGDTPNKAIYTCQKIIELEPKTVRIYPTLVIQDTELEQLYHAGLYRPLTLDQAVEQTTVLYSKFLDAHIDVIRVGLHPSEELQDSGYIAGPFHPAFRQLVESQQWLHLLESMVDEDTLVYANRLDISNVIGHQKMNIETFRKKGIKLVVKEKVIAQGFIEIKGCLHAVK